METEMVSTKQVLDAVVYMYGHARLAFENEDLDIVHNMLNFIAEKVGYSLREDLKAHTITASPIKNSKVYQ